MSHGDRLSELIAEFVSLQQRGDSITIEDFAARHPDHRDELLELLPTLSDLDDFAATSIKTSRVSIGGKAYHILEPLGRGGMGTVYLAESLDEGRSVAIKVLSSRALGDPELRARFAREAAVARKLRHPNLVSVYGSGLIESVPCLVAEYVPGADLARIIASMRESGQGPSLDAFVRATREQSPEYDGAMPEAIDGIDAQNSSTAQHTASGYFGQIAALVADIAEGLAHAHENGIVHRDVKPHNILIDEDLTPRLTDFGLAHRPPSSESSDGVSHSGDQLGTPHYMSPEMLRVGATEVDGRTDVYSLGVTLYELLTLRLPFAARSSLALMHSIEHDPTPWPQRRNPAVPAPLQAIVLKAMEKAPADRYRSAAEFAEDLRRFLDHEPILARTPGRCHRGLRWLSRHRWAVGAAGLVTAGLLVTQQVSAHQLESDRQANMRISGTAHAAGREFEAFHHARLADEIRSDTDSREMMGRALGLRRLTVQGLPAGLALTVEPLRGFLAHDDAGRAVFAQGMMLPQGDYVIRARGDGRGSAHDRVFELAEDVALALPERTATPPPGMIAIPAGEYTVGEPTPEVSLGRDPLPLRTVTVEGFWMDAHEVTNAQYFAFVEDTGHRPSPHWSSKGIEPANMPADFAQKPVVKVTLDDAMAYAAWAGKRLPTEIEWEIAARGPQRWAYPFGPEYRPDVAACWPTDTESSFDLHCRRVDRPTDDRSPFGVFHMSGNAAEWVLGVVEGEGSAPTRWVVKGSSWMNPPNERMQRAAERSAWPRDTSLQSIGFRCVVPRPR